MNPSILFQSVRMIVKAEAESLRKGKEPQSITMQANRIKKRQEVCALVNLVVRLADKSK